ncbi:MAG: N-acetyltransferase [Balneolaceae bacterium]|nr:MAG: N-acetyltransferase [Balneolaceae bacterium]
MNIHYTLIHNDRDETPVFNREEVADFLYRSLQQYGDEKESILKCIAYAYGDGTGQDGFVMLAHDEKNIVGAVIINDTNMGGYIPEHILVYIAVDPKTRGMGVGKELMRRVIEVAEGDIALHVEPDNPARQLYEKFGFTNKYLEMRRRKSEK